MRWSAETIYSHFANFFSFDLHTVQYRAETEICWLKDDSWLQKKKMPSTEVPYQYLLIESTLHPSPFWLDTTFKLFHRCEQQRVESLYVINHRDNFITGVTDTSGEFITVSRHRR